MMKMIQGGKKGSKEGWSNTKINWGKSLNKIFGIAPEG